MKFKTIIEGNEAVVYNYLGEGKLLKGPCRVFLFRERLQRLSHYTATANQYLKIKDNRGYVSHKQGPCEMFHNPLENQSVEVQPAIIIDANHVIVVYKKLKDNSVERRIVGGPIIFMPEAEEWLHDFQWHGQDPNELGHMIVNGAQFKKMLIIPSRFYYNVRDVRTIDDTMLSVKLLIFYEFVDVLKMLENTQDPIADMINAICADVIAFAGKLKLGVFLQSAPGLNNVDMYNHLLQRAENIGIHISKVVYLGYHADDKLQDMQDRTIESRTRMRLQGELQQQEQKLMDYKLQMEQDRLKLEQETQQVLLDYTQKTGTMNKGHDLQMKHLVHDADVEREAVFSQLDLDMDKKRKEEELAHFSNLKNLNINLTQYLIQDQGHPVHEEYRVSRERTDKASS